MNQFLKMSEAEREILHKASLNREVPAEDILSAVFPMARVTREDDLVVFDLRSWVAGSLGNTP